MSQKEKIDLSEPETLYEIAEQLSVVFAGLVDGPVDGLELIASQHLQLALSSLTAAIAQFRIAAASQARALAGSR